MYISKEAHERFLREIQRQIDEAQKNSKEKAERILNAMTENYNKMLNERIADELAMEEVERKEGNLAAAQAHKLRAEILQSVLNAKQPGR